MSEEVKKTETKSPAKEALDLRKTRVEILEKIQDMKTQKVLDEVEIEKSKVELERERIALEQLKKKEAGWSHPIDKLLDVAGLWYIDNDRSVGTEPALRSFWDEEEIRFIKKQIMKKVKEL